MSFAESVYKVVVIPQLHFIHANKSLDCNKNTMLRCATAEFLQKMRINFTNHIQQEI